MPQPDAAGETDTISPAVADGWLGHFLRSLGVAWLVGLGFYLVVGFVWLAHIFDRTGHRKRDLLWLLVPVAGVVIETRALWRYTARTVYWTPRAERPPDLLRGWQRPWSIAAGLVLGPLVFGAFVAADLDEGSTTQAREDIGAFEGEDFGAFDGDLYRSDQGRFAVAFPAEVSRSVTSDVMGGVTIESTSYYATNDGFSYAVTYIDVPEGVPTFLDAELDGLVQYLDNGEVTSRSATTVAGSEALRASAIHDDGEAEILIVRAPDRVYVVVAEGEDTPDDADTFLDSFDIEG